MGLFDVSNIRRQNKVEAQATANVDNPFSLDRTLTSASLPSTESQVKNAFSIDRGVTPTPELDTTPSEPTERGAGFAVSELVKSVASNSESLFGTLAKGVGAVADIGTDAFEGKDTWYNNAAKSTLQGISKNAKSIGDYWQREAGVGWEAPDAKLHSGTFMENPSWLRAGTLVAGAIPSLAAAATMGAGLVAGGMSQIGAVALTSATMGFGMEAPDTYWGIKEATGDRERAKKLYAVHGIGAAILESLPLKAFLDVAAGKTGKKLTRKALMSELKKEVLGQGRFVRKAAAVGKAGAFIAGQEATEEVSQQLLSNIIAKAGYDKTRKLTEGLIESMIAGAGSGGMLGGFTAASVSNTDRLLNEVVEQGVTRPEIEKLMMNIAMEVQDNRQVVEQKIKSLGAAAAGFTEGEYKPVKKSETGKGKKKVTTYTVDVDGSEVTIKYSDSGFGPAQLEFSTDKKVISETGYRNYFLPIGYEDDIENDLPTIVKSLQDDFLKTQKSKNRGKKKKLKPKRKLPGGSLQDQMDARVKKLQRNAKKHKIDGSLLQQINNLDAFVKDGAKGADLAHWIKTIFEGKLSNKEVAKLYKRYTGEELPSVEIEQEAKLPPFKYKEFAERLRKAKTVDELFEIEEEYDAYESVKEKMVQRLRKLRGQIEDKMQEEVYGPEEVDEVDVPTKEEIKKVQKKLRGKGKKKAINTLWDWVTSVGGIKIDSEVKSRGGVKKIVGDYALRHTLFSKKGILSLEQIAMAAVTDGALPPVPENRHAADWLLEHLGERYVLPHRAEQLGAEEAEREAQKDAKKAAKEDKAFLRHINDTLKALKGKKLLDALLKMDLSKVPDHLVKDVMKIKNKYVDIAEKELNKFKKASLKKKLANLEKALDAAINMAAKESDPQERIAKVRKQIIEALNQIDELIGNTVNKKATDALEKLRGK